jgi:tetratricopeptide (TPR) repeat protein
VLGSAQSLVNNTIVVLIAVGNYPTSVAFDPNTNMTYVANGGDNILSIIAPPSTEVLLPPANETNKLANTGIAKFSLGDYEGAIKYFDQCLTMHPNSVACFYNKGLALDKLGRTAEASEYKDRAQQIDPNYKGGYVLKANFTPPSLSFPSLPLP